MQPPLKLAALYAVFFLSGVCGLGYQVVWTRMLATGLGHEMPAMLAVVAAFFGGFAAGAWSLDRSVSRSPRPALWYVALEVITGFWGFLSIFLMPHVNDLALKLIGIDSTPLRHWTVALALPFIALAPATAAMGATLPALERFLAPMTADGKCVSALYSLNTFGAAAGALACTFVVTPALGFDNTVRLLSALNILCGLTVLMIELRPRSQPGRSNQSLAAAVPTQRLYVTVFFTGLLGIGYEVLGVRALGQVLEGTVYTYTVTLAVYLIGTTIGAALYHWRLRPLRFAPSLGFLLTGTATSCLFGAWLVARAPIVYERLRAAWGDSPLAVAAAELTVAVTVFGLPTVFMGAAFGHLAQWAKRDDGGVGRAIALNTLGGAIAPALFGVMILPAVGLKWSLVTVSVGYLFLLPRIAGWRRFGLAAPVGFVLLLPGKIQLVQVPPRGRLVEFREGVMDSVAVVEHFDGNRTLLVNNRFAMGGTGSVVAERRHAHIPLLLHPEPKRALFLGLGTGITFAAAGAHPELKADGVELVPEVVDVMPQFKPYNDLPGDGARLKTHVSDARRFVRAGDARYDVIVADLFHPARDGAGTLYTQEHFRAIRNRLTPGGLFCQWLPLHQLDEEMLRVIVRTFLEVFPDTRAWLLRFNVDTPVLGLIGTLEPTKYPPGWWEQRARDAGLREQLKPLTLTDDYQLFGCLLAGSDALRDFSSGATLNTDDRPVIIFGAPRFTYQRRAPTYGRMFSLLDLGGAEPRELVQNRADGSATKFSRELSDFIHARDVYLRGLVIETEGRMSKAIDSYVESARLSPNFSTGYARCLTIAMQQSAGDPKSARELLQRLVEAQPERPVARELLERLKE